MIETLEKQILNQNQLNEELAAQKQEVNELKTNLVKQQEAFEKDKEQLLESFRQKQQVELNQVLKQAREHLETIIEAQKSHDVLDEIQAITKLEPTLEKVEIISEKEFVVGDTVRIAGTNQIGLITEINKQQVSLDVRGMRMQAKLNQLQHHQAEKKQKKKAVRSSVSVSATTPMQLEVNVIGLRVEEAQVEINNYLDQAILNKLESGRIIHGHGTGALRSATHVLLKKHKAVKSFRLGGENEGGVGATVISFKS